MAVQLSISLDSPIEIFDKNEKRYEFQNTLITSGTTHRVQCESAQLLLLFYPTSSIGHFLQNHSNNAISTFQNESTDKLRVIGSGYVNGKISFEEFIKQISSTMTNLACNCKDDDHYGDERIKKAIAYLEENYERIIPIEEICDIACLSESRFLHLFKETTGVTYRKAQQWYKVSKAFSTLFTTNITNTAYDAGFADSAHFTKVCKETFGFSPKILKGYKCKTAPQ